MSVAASAIWASPASAFERGYPGFAISPGVFVNIPATTPPPGFYGGLVGFNGYSSIVGPGAPHVNNLATTNQGATFTATLLWVPGFNVLGAVYSAGVAQQFGQVSVGAPINVRFDGVHDTIFTVGALGWKLGDSGLYVKTALQVSVPNGTIDGTNGLGNDGNPWTTFLPRVNVTYSRNGYTLNVNGLIEVSTTNYISDYKTGDILRFEGSLTKTFDKLTVGPVGTYIGQITSDTSSKFYNYATNLNRYNVAAVGAFIGYDFGPVSLSTFGTKDVLANASGGTRNAVLPDTASITSGYRVFVAANFRIPGLYDKPAGQTLTARY